MADEEDSVYCENRQGKGNKDPVKAWVFAPNSKYDKYWENRHHERVKNTWSVEIKPCHGSDK